MGASRLLPALTIKPLQRRLCFASDVKSQAGKVYELAGDAAFTMAEYAAEVSRQSGKTVVYNDLPGGGIQGSACGLLVCRSRWLR